MAGDEYASVGGGGLKLKGVKGSKVEKRHKKKAKKVKEASDETATPLPYNETSTKRTSDAAEPAAAEEAPNPSKSRENGFEADTIEPRPTKTPTELRHEERRRKMLDERLKREGVKTHKERVEELNKYLSGLSEHHDMPKIGPG